MTAKKFFSNQLILVFFFFFFFFFFSFKYKKKMIWSTFLWNKIINIIKKKKKSRIAFKAYVWWLDLSISNPCCTAWIFFIFIYSFFFFFFFVFVLTRFRIIIMEYFQNIFLFGYFHISFDFQTLFFFFFFFFFSPLPPVTSYMFWKKWSTPLPSGLKREKKEKIYWRHHFFFFFFFSV